MGALTAKKHAFTFRTWEPKTFKEIDETEVKKFFIRSEHLKVTRTRILPIKYWISDKKRFSEPVKTQTYPIILFENSLIFNIDYCLKEIRKTQYIISNVEGYKYILAKISDNTLGKISCFFARQFPKRIPENLSILEDIIIKKKKTIREPIENFENLIKTRNVLLLTNPRLESPAFNAFLYKNAEEFNFTSLSTFNSNIDKEEIPESSFIFYRALKGYLNVKDMTIIASPISSIPFFEKSTDIVTLTPLYMNQKITEFEKEEKNELNMQLFQKNRKIFKPVFLTTAYSIGGKGDIYLTYHSFDNFVQKKISTKYLERLFILYSILTLEQNNKKYKINNITTNPKNALSVLFQTLKTI